MLNWNTSKEDYDTIIKIAERYIQNAIEFEVPKVLQRPKLEVIMDIEATHNNGCQLKLEELLSANDGNFMHDVCGIMANLNRKTGKLENCFLPRYNKKERE